jgi:epoxyqueuosine reductase
MGPEEVIVDELRQRALAHGFTLFGVAPATEADGYGRFCDWLDAGYAGQMKYLHKHREHRRHPKAVLQSVRSVVMLGYEYAAQLPELPAKVARYAHGPDYHPMLWAKLNDLSAWIIQAVPGSFAHGAADSAPLLERDFARRAGLGWFGKNTMLLNKQRGSYFFLAGLLTSVELPTTKSVPENHCGTCTACLDACPTQAFPAPGTLDATRCISYLTIELHGSIPLPLRSGIGDWLFGCDVCQEVCPWNRFANTRTSDNLLSLDPVKLLSITEEEFKERFQHTAIYRTRRQGLVRNAAIVLGNSGNSSALPALEQATHDADEVVREAAQWAIDQIRQRGA